MATSESDDFESADEEMNARTEKAAQPTRVPKRYTSIGSDSDDDVDYIPVQYHTPIRGQNKKEFKSSSKSKQAKAKDKSQMEDQTISDKNVDNTKNNKEQKNKISNTENDTFNEESKEPCSTKEETDHNIEKTKGSSNRRERPQRQRKPREAQSLGAKKLGATKIDKLPDVETTTPDKVRETAIAEGKPAPLIQECWEEWDEKNLEEELKNAAQNAKLKKDNVKVEDTEDVPAELKSNLKFKDIFKPDGWEGLGEDVELPDDLSDDKYQPVLDKLASNTKQPDDINGSWGSWGSWGVSSLLNTATASVNTLTSHVTQGLSLLEETIGVPDPGDLAKPENPLEENPKSEVLDKTPEESKESPSQYLPSFGFGNFMSSVSSITKLVESTSTKVISGGLDTLESIGKKTMEVLQEGDPGLKKKRAFFLNESDKPILSQVLREAKDKADAEEKTSEEKQLARKIHFESLFDDYQGLVHLEALEMLSKQSIMKIQQQLVNLDGSDLTSMQETLDEVKELCDYEDEEEEDDEVFTKLDFKHQLEEGCKDLGVTIKYDKILEIWNQMNSQSSLADLKEISHREIFQKAISALAQFTAYSVERFHKTAEMLLIKERRSTVNEADSLLLLTKALSSQIASIANLYCNYLREVKEESLKVEINSSITTISLEATNASSYIQEAFRLLIPILQVGAI